MERLAVYTSIDGTIYTKVIKPRGNECYLLPIPQGRVTLKKHTVGFKFDHQYTEIYVETDKENLLNDPEIIEKALEVYSEDMIYESCFKI